MPSAEIITIGTEILLGEIVDTNTRYIARSLRELGIDLFRTSTIGDNVERIAQAVNSAAARADIVITTGGLGPTVDDPTRAAIAQAAGVQSVFQEALWQQIIERLAKYGRTPTENQKRQAYIPAGAIPVANPVGTAPAFILDNARSTIIALPGVSLEMEYLLQSAVIPYLQKRFSLNSVILVRVLHVAGVGESQIDELIGDLEVQHNPTVGLAAHAGIVDVRIAVKAPNQESAEHLIHATETIIRERLDGMIFGADDDTLEHAVLELLAQQGWKMTIGEYGTAQKLAKKMRNSLFPEQVFCEEFNAPLPTTLQEEIKHRMQHNKTSSGFGIYVYTEQEKQGVEMYFKTPLGEDARFFSYGGHPRKTANWAVNVTLEALRRHLKGIG